MPYRLSRQPIHRLVLDEMDRGNFRRYVAIGPSQSGKTTVAWLIPLLYHLFERGHTVVCGVPDSSMVNDLWSSRILPAIEASRYRNLLPRFGEGARGGRVEQRVDLLNGACIRFMTAQGGRRGDKSRASFTAQAIFVTEAEAFEGIADDSREANKLAQLEARARAHGAKARSYIECTVTTEDGLAWSEYIRGSEARIHMPCPHCRAWSVPHRAELVGWQTAEDERTAMEQCGLACPHCGAKWTETERRAAVTAAKLVHRGQSIESDGTVVGDLPRTLTCGIRWTAAHNLIVPISEAARDEWLAESAGSDTKKRELAQFVWCEPTKLTDIEEGHLDALEIRRRAIDGTPRGRVPDSAVVITIGVDVGLYRLDWMAFAWSPDGSGHVIDYGTEPVPSRNMPEEQAFDIAFDSLDERLRGGWPGGNRDRESPDLIVSDSGNFTEHVYRATRRLTGEIRWVPSKGYGSGQRGARSYSHPKTRSRLVRRVGARWNMIREPAQGVERLDFDADAWKTVLFGRVRAKVGTPGAVTLFTSATRTDHSELEQQWAAEKRVIEFDPKHGETIQWRTINRANHKWDAAVLATVAADVVGLDPTTPARRGRSVGGSIQAPPDWNERVTEAQRRAT